MIEIFKLAAAVIASTGMAGVVIFGLSSWLGKIWANKILENDRARYQREIESLKGLLQLQIREHEIKTNVIQAERNSRILELAPLISQAFGHCYVYAELGEIAQREGFPEDFYLQIQKLSSESLNSLWDATRKSELFLSDEIFTRINDFQKKLWSLRKQTSDSLYDGELDPITKQPIEKRDISEIFKELKEGFEDEKKALMTEFRHLLGTNPAKELQQDARVNVASAP